MGHLFRNLPVSLRQFRAFPGFAATVVLTLALGIGGTTAIFSVIKAVVLNPLPFRDPQRLVHVREGFRGGHYHRGDDAYFIFRKARDVLRLARKAKALRRCAPLDPGRDQPPGIRWLLIGVHCRLHCGAPCDQPTVSGASAPVEPGSDASAEPCDFPSLRAFFFVAWRFWPAMRLQGAPCVWTR